MQVGVPKEIKDKEYRVGLTPASVRELVSAGHQVCIEKDAGLFIGFDNTAYQCAGASIVDSAVEVFKQAQLILKVKEPQPHECRMLTPKHVLFTYLHLAPDPQQAQLLCESGATCIAYETVTDATGGLPLLSPMSEVAGRLAVQAGAHHLEAPQGGSGTLLGGVTGVEPAKVLVLGGGVVGTQAAIVAAGMGAQVTVVDRSLARLRQLDEIFASRVQCLFSTLDTIERLSAVADLVIGAVLIPGGAAPKLLTRHMIGKMKRGAVVVDVAIDQGGCFETSKPTTHTSPSYEVDGVIHYCVANMPSAAARTATEALNNATLPFVCALADKGVKDALKQYPGLLPGINIVAGKITHSQVACSLQQPCQDALVLLKKGC